MLKHLDMRKVASKVELERSPSVEVETGDVIRGSHGLRVACSF